VLLLLLVSMLLLKRLCIFFVLVFLLPSLFSYVYVGWVSGGCDEGMFGR
jgi:hypothetical protein